MHSVFHRACTIATRKEAASGNEVGAAAGRFSSIVNSSLVGLGLVVDRKQVQLRPASQAVAGLKSYRPRSSVLSLSL
jgi:hypothetical protein